MYCNSKKKCTHLSIEHSVVKNEDPSGYCDLLHVQLKLSEHKPKQLFIQDTDCMEVLPEPDKIIPERPPKRIIAEDILAKKPVIQPGDPHNRDEVMSHNVGDSNYAQKKIQPWHIWEEYLLNPWDADIVKRVLRDKSNQSRREDYEKIIHICQKRISQIDDNIEGLS